MPGSVMAIAFDICAFSARADSVAGLQRAHHRAMAALLFARAYHQRAGQLVVPSLLLAVERDPDQSHSQRHDGDEIAEKTSDVLTARWRRTGYFIPDDGRNRHLTRRRVARCPER